MRLFNWYNSDIDIIPILIEAQLIIVIERKLSLFCDFCPFQKKKKLVAAKTTTTIPILNLSQFSNRTGCLHLTWVHPPQLLYIIVTPKHHSLLVLLLLLKLSKYIVIMLLLHLLNFKNLSNFSHFYRCLYDKHVAFQLVSYYTPLP